MLIYSMPQIADILQIDLEQGESSRVFGITGAGEIDYKYKVDLTIGGHLFKNIEVGFLKNMGEQAYGIVGQKGFFDLFAVKFDLTKEQIELIPKRS